MSDNNKKLESMFNHVVLHGVEGDVGFDEESVNCFFPLEDKALTRIYLASISGQESFDVVETPEEIMMLLDVPFVKLKAHEDETYTQGDIYINVLNISYYSRDNANEVTQLRHKAQAGTSAYYLLEDEPAAIREKICGAGSRDFSFK